MATRLRIKRSVMDSGCFVDFRRITRKFVPKNDQDKCVPASTTVQHRTAEREMPERRVTHDFVPGGMPHAAHPSRTSRSGFYRAVTGGIGIGNRCANVMPNDRRNRSIPSSVRTDRISLLCVSYHSHRPGVKKAPLTRSVSRERTTSLLCIACRSSAARGSPPVSPVNPESVKQHDRRALFRRSDMNCRRPSV